MLLMLLDVVFFFLLLLLVRDVCEVEGLVRRIESMYADVSYRYDVHQQLLSGG